MTKHPAKRIRQNIHRLYHESVKREIEFKRAVKALPMFEIKPIKRVRVKPNV